MLARVTVLWVVGLLTLVPYGTYYLLFEASRDQYAWLIILILFWLFGFWALAGPLLLAHKVRTVSKAILDAGLRGDLRQALARPETRDLAIDLIATDNRIPRFIADRVYDLVLTRVISRSRPGAAPPENEQRS